jgi:hypothetical protein
MQNNNRKQTPNGDRVNFLENRWEPVNKSRRKALKKIAVGGAAAGALALTGKWVKPVVNTIILPAHAQATNAEGPANTTTPSPTTTTCNTVIADRAFDTHRDGEGFYDQPVRVWGTVDPPAAGQTVQVHLGLWYDGGTEYIYTDYSAITDVTGTWSVTNDNYAGAYDAVATITGPCGDTAEIRDSNQPA